MESLHASSKPFWFRDASTTKATGSDALQTLQSLHDDRKILHYDFYRLTEGDLKPYAQALTDVVNALSFTRWVPQPVDCYTDYVAREQILHERAAQGHAVTHEVRDNSPLRTVNLLHVCLYDELYRALCRQGAVQWHDRQTQRRITDLARIIRDALMPGGQAGEIEDNEQDPLGGKHRFHDIQSNYALLGERLGIPLSACPQLGMRFTVEKEVIEAAQAEFGCAPDNPLLVFAYDCERHYATGMANGWRKALSLIDKLREEGFDALTWKQLERLHEACTEEVKSTAGSAMQSIMGADGASYGVFKSRGLTKEGEKELSAYYDELNSLSGEALEQTAAARRKTAQDLVRLERLKGVGVHLARRLLFKNADDDIRHVRQLAEHYLARFRQAIREADKAKKGGRAEEGEKVEEAENAAAVRDAQIMAVIDLCQALERLHPFGDANGRLFEMLLPSILLLALGQEAYLPCHPYFFDGGSRMQVREEIERGQAEVRKLREMAMTAVSQR